MNNIIALIDSAIDNILYAVTTDRLDDPSAVDALDNARQDLRAARTIAQAMLK